jgi:hypothetical protein
MRPVPLEGILLPAAPTIEESSANLRAKSPVLWAALKCRATTNAAYGKRWQTVAVTVMM